MQRRRFLQGALAAAAGAVMRAPASAATEAARTLRIDDFRRLSWEDAGGAAPLIVPPWPSPIIADPSLVVPAESPDGHWHLFAHGALGIHHFTTPDPLRWTHGELALWHGMRAALLAQPGEWLLHYEAYPPFALARTALPAGLRPAWRSWIARRDSRTLRDWGDAQVVLEPHADWQRNELGAAVGNPCVVRIADAGPDAWALYYSGGLRWIPDCGFTEPFAIARALGPTPRGPWRAEGTPLLAPRADDPVMNLSAGALKVMRAADGFIGLQNAIGWDGTRSRSAIWLLWSADGRSWHRAPEPLLAPGAPAWRGSHVYACDLRFDPSQRRWWLFYNARDVAEMGRGREAIGALHAAG